MPKVARAAQSPPGTNIPLAASSGKRCRRLRAHRGRSLPGIRADAVPDRNPLLMAASSSGDSRNRCSAVLSVPQPIFLSQISARRAGEPLEDYVARSLPYLRSMSFASDLFLKFSVLSMLILAGRPDWIAPFCLVGLADYIFQGRFFRPSVAIEPSRRGRSRRARCAPVSALVRNTFTSVRGSARSLARISRAASRASSTES